MNKQYTLQPVVTKREPTGIKMIRNLVILAIFLGAPANTLAGMDAPSEQIIHLLLEGTEATYTGNYDKAWSLFEHITDIDPEHPAREFYLSTVLFWKINVDPNNPIYDKQITRLLEDCINKSEKLLTKNPNDIEALHYIGLAYTYLGRLDAHRGRMYAGGVKGETGRKYLEQAIAICPSGMDNQGKSDVQAGSDFCEDLYFPLGAYSYFAGKLPDFLKSFNFLWFVPKGSTQEGLAYLKRAADHSRLHDLSARFLLISIYMLFEKGHLQEAYEMWKPLIRRFPNNPYLDLQHAEILLAMGKYKSGIRHAEQILKKTTQVSPYYGKGVELQAKLFIAEALLHENQPDQATSILNDLAGDPVFLNHTYTSKIYLLLGMVKDSQKKRQDALKMYALTLDQDDRKLSRNVKKQAEAYIEKPFSLFPGKN